MGIESDAITAIVKNNDIGLAFTEGAEELFSSYEDVWQGLHEYYNKYKALPSLDYLEENYRDFEASENIGDLTKPYIDKLRNERIKSKIRQMFLQYASRLDDVGGPQALEEITTSLQKINRLNYASHDLNIMDFQAANEYYEHAKSISEEFGSPGIPTGFASIDRCYPTGMAGGQLIYLIGYSGKGKTWAGLDLALNTWKFRRKPMVISLEMSTTEVRDRLYTIMGEGTFSASGFARGDVNTDNFMNWSMKQEGMPDFTIISNEGVDEVTPNFIQGKIEKYEPSFVLLDYVQLAMDNERSDGMTVRMQNLSRQLKLMAARNNIPVVAISAVTDDDASSRDEPPRIDQFRWSKSLEYDASLVVAVHKHTDSDLIEFVGRKNRYGPLFDFYVNWDIDRGIITESFDD